MIARNRIRRDMGSDCGRIRDVEFVKSFLTVIDEVERFPSREMAFPVDVIFEKRWVVALVELGIQNTVNILSTFTILGNDWFAGFLMLARQEIISHMA